MMPSAQQTTTQKNKAGVTTTTTVTTTAPAQPIVLPTTLGSIGMVKSIERKIEAQKKNNETKQPLNEILDKTLSVSTRKEKPIPDKLSFRSTDSLDELPTEVIEIISTNGFTFEPGDRVVHIPGAYYFSFIKMINDKKEFHTFSLNQPMTETDKDISNDQNELQPKTVKISVSKETPNNPINETEKNYIQESLNPVDQEIITTDIVSQPSETNIDSTGTLGTISVSQNNITPNDQENTPIVKPSETGPDNVSQQSTTLNELETKTNDEKVIEPPAWSFDKEIIHGPPPEVALAESIKQTASFGQLRDILFQERTFANHMSDDVWTLVRNYTHGLISLERIPQDFGLQQQVQKLFDAWKDDQKLLELEKKETLQPIEKTLSTPETSIAKLLEQTLRPIDTGAQSVLEELGLGNIQKKSLPTSEKEILPTMPPILETMPLENNEVHSDTQKNISETLPVVSQENIEQKSLPETISVSHTGVYQSILDQLYQLFSVQT